MLGRVLSGSALFLMGWGRKMASPDRKKPACGLERCSIPAGIDGKAAGAVTREAGRERPD